MSLDRFVSAYAQAHGGYVSALNELRRGRKTSHWIWYIFPQLKGLGRSGNATFYGITDLTEAREYLRHGVLREHLLACTRAVQEQLTLGIPLVDLMNSEVDALKLVSSLTLFERAADTLTAEAPADPSKELLAPCRDVLTRAEQQGFPRCQSTLTLLRERES